MINCCGQSAVIVVVRVVRPSRPSPSIPWSIWPHLLCRPNAPRGNRRPHGARCHARPGSLSGAPRGRLHSVDGCVHRMSCRVGDIAASDHSVARCQLENSGRDAFFVADTAACGLCGCTGACLARLAHRFSQCIEEPIDAIAPPPHLVVCSQCNEISPAPLQNLDG